MADILSPTAVESRFDVEADEAQRLVNASERFIENYINTNVLHQSETDLFEGGFHHSGINAYDDARWILDKKPVKYGSLTITDKKDGSTVDSSEYYVDNDQGIIEFKNPLPQREVTERWKVDYEAGLAPDASELDADIKEAALMIIALMDGDRNELQEFQLGDKSWKKKAENDDDIKMLLEPYVVRAV